MTNIETIYSGVLVKYPLFGDIVAKVNCIENYQCYSNGMPTMATDGKNIYYHPDSLKDLTVEEGIFLFAHELTHIALNHIFRSEGKELELWNIATDAVVNAFLTDDGLPLPKNAIDMPEAIHYAAEEVYEKLLEEKGQKQKEQATDQKGPQNNGTGGQNSEQNQSSDCENSEMKDVGHDTHSMWKKAVENKNSGKNSEDQAFDDEIQKFSEMGEKEVFKKNKVERKKRLEELRDAIIQQSCGAGKDSSGIDRNITDIGATEALIDWRRLLSACTNHEVDWTYQNATIEYGVLTPHLEENPTPETEILLDTSGSVSDVLLKNFLRECKNILRTSKLKVGCFDTQFYGFTDIRNEYDIDHMKFSGGGGTNFDVAVRAFSKSAENKIIFTDGDASMPDIEVDVVWIVFGSLKIKPKGGKVIYISPEQLEKLFVSFIQEDFATEIKR